MYLTVVLRRTQAYVTDTTPVNYTLWYKETRNSLEEIHDHPRVVAIPAGKESWLSWTFELTRTAFVKGDGVIML